MELILRFSVSFLPRQGAAAHLREREMSGFGPFVIAASVVLLLAAFSFQPASAQTRTLTTLADVPALIPVPYHPHTLTAVYGASLYDGHPYYGGVYAGGARYLH
jgi:hypothetical protein